MIGIATTPDAVRHLERLRADDQLPPYEPIVIDTHGRVLDGDPGSARVLWRRVNLPAQAVAEALAVLPNLELLHNDTVGLDTLPLDVLRRHRDLRVTVPENAYALGMAEWLVTAVLWRCKRLADYQRASDAGRWERPAGVRSAAGSVIACYGAGRTIRRATTALSVLGAELILTGRRRHPDHATVDWPTWLDALPRADFLVLAAPLTRETLHSITDDVLERLQGTCLINLARGELIAPGALEKARSNGNVESAVLDAHATEPLPDSDAAWKDSEILVLPHDTWRYQGVGKAQGADFAHAVTDHLAGRGRYASVQHGY